MISIEDLDQLPCAPWEDACDARNVYDAGKCCFIEMSATAEELFDFGHKMSLEYLP